MSWIAVRGAMFRSLLALCLAGAIGCGDLHPNSSTSPGESFPDATDIEDGSVSIVSGEFFVDQENRFYSNLAHLLGGSLNGHPLHFAGNIRIKNDNATAQTVFVKASMQGYSEVAQQRVDLGPNETKTIQPIDLTFDFDELYSVTSAVNANVQLSVYQNDSLVDLRTASVSVEPINRFRWFVGQGNEKKDFRAFAVGLVTPEDRGNEVQTLLTEAAQYASSGSIVGYQGGTIESAADQAKAVYEAIQARNIVYTNVVGSFFDGAQNVKLPAQSLTTGSANCIDGTLVFASAFEAMGMQPKIVFMTGHALVGVKLDPNDDDSVLYIETTLVGSAGFRQAVESAQATIQDRVDQEDPLLLSIDVVAARQIGITPVNL